MSLAYAPRRLRGCGASSVRLFVRVSATSQCGNTKNSKWSLPRANSSKRSSVSCSGAGASTPCSVNAGTQRSVTSAIAPSAPRPDAGSAEYLFGSVRGATSVEPSASTSDSSQTWEEMLRRRAPVPCVAVEIAPAIALHVDVTQVLERQAMRRRAPAQLADRDARLHAHEPRLAVDVEHARQPPQADHQPVRAGDVAERVPAARDAHAQSAALRLRDRRGELLARSPGSRIVAGAQTLVARPVVPPGGAGLLIARLAHQMDEPEPNATPAVRACLARTLAADAGTAARDGDRARARSARALAVLLVRAGCARPCRRAPPSRPR